MISRAQRVLRRVQRERQADRHRRLCGEAVDPRDPADGRDRRAAVRDADVRQALRHASSTASRFIIGSPMPMKTTWSTRLDAAEVQRLVEDLRRGEVAAELHRAGRAERAGQRAAGLRATGRASGGRRGSASARPRPGGRRAVGNSALTVPSRDVRPRSTSDSVENGTRSAERRAQRRREVRHLLVAGRAARGPLPDLAGAEARLRRGRPACVCRRSRSIARPMVGAGCASRSTSPTPASPRAARAEDIVHAGRVTVGGETVRDPARDVDERSDVAVDGKPVAGAEPHVIYALHKPAGVGLDGEGHARPPHRRRPRVAGAGAAVSRRAPRRRHDRPDPAHQRRRARQPAHAPALRGAARPTARQVARPPVREARAARAARRASSSRTA